MNRLSLLVLLVVLSSFGCAASGASTDATEVSVNGQTLVVEGIADATDASWWAIEIRSIDAEISPIVITSDDPTSLDSEALRAVRDTHGSELIASGTWYGCGLVHCADGAAIDCIAAMRANGCY